MHQQSTIIKVCRPTQFYSLPTQYGQDNESTALRTFVNFFKSQHADVEVRSCGLILSNEFPGFGASPELSAVHVMGKTSLKSSVHFHGKTVEGLPNY